MTVVAIEEALKKVQQTTADQETRDATKLAVGDGVRQGDLYIARIKSVRTCDRVGRGGQLVDGTTRGARHVLVGDYETFRGEASMLPEWVSRDAPLALFFCVGSGGASLTHPEHAHVTLGPNTTWAAWQQMDARTMRRVQD